MATRPARSNRSPAVLWQVGADRVAAALLGLMALLLYAAVPQGFMPMAAADGVVRIMPCPQQGGALQGAATDDAAAMPGHDMAASGSQHQPPASTYDHGKCAFAGMASIAAPPPAIPLADPPVSVRLPQLPVLAANAIAGHFPPRPHGQAPPARS